ncbi:unnamed protein product [Cyprideis torosa]|uniref:Uncharacterized protein n=1 Tax=Cyprideis torosa TaxID=163714 RepID=A0A7R8WT23_9CRUS|nr:unnamed protein product [Cyprideis torosa]CAG0908645.1 unnamed protein product [Cyprideis torosa]
MPGDIRPAGKPLLPPRGQGRVQELVRGPGVLQRSKLLLGGTGNARRSHIGYLLHARHWRMHRVLDWRGGTGQFQHLRLAQDPAARGAQQLAQGTTGRPHHGRRRLHVLRLGLPVG